MQGSASESRLETDSDRCPPPEAVRIGHRDDEGAAGNSPSLATFQRSYSHCTAVARVPRHSGAATHRQRESCQSSPHCQRGQAGSKTPMRAPMPSRRTAGREPATTAAAAAHSPCVKCGSTIPKTCDGRSMEFGRFWSGEVRGGYAWGCFKNIRGKKLK